VVFAASLWSNVTATKQRVKSETGTQKTFLFSEPVEQLSSAWSHQAVLERAILGPLPIGAIYPSKFDVLDGTDFQQHN
jgi:hypothetical protein